MNLDQIGLAVVTKPEVHRTVARRSVAHAGGHVIVLSASNLTHDFDSCADTVAITLDASESDFQPVIAVLAAVLPNFGFLAQRGHNHVNAAIAVKICKRAASMTGLGPSAQSGSIG